MVEVRERGWWAELMRWSLMQHGVGRLARRFSICSGIYAETASFYAHAKPLHCSMLTDKLFQMEGHIVERNKDYS